MHIKLSRIPLMLLAIISLLLGIITGWHRMGLPHPRPTETLPVWHGILMVNGFLGTLIGLERAVAMKKWWSYGAPLFAGVGTLLFLIPGISPKINLFLLVIASGIFSIILLLLLRQHRSLAIAIMFLAGLMWLVGNLVAMNSLYLPQSVLWWGGFLVLTIAGERLELSKLLKLTAQARFLFLTMVVLLVIAALTTHFLEYPLSFKLAGLGWLGLAFWLYQFDLARRTVRQPGLPRFIAICLLSGYFWLFIAGGLSLGLTIPPAGFYYDAVLHAIFVGFVFSMIFGHAPIIFPSVLELTVQFSKGFYVPLILLHLSLVSRVIFDLAIAAPGRLYSGIGNGVAILLFFILMIFSIVKNRPKTT